MLEHKKILVATDGSKYAERGLEYAVSLASIGGSEIVLLHVVPYFSDPAVNFWKTPAVDAIDRRYLDRLRKNAEKLLEAEIKRLQKVVESRIKFTPMIEFGDPAEKILEVADRINADLIVIGVRGKSSWKKKIVGSVSDTILNRAKIPVMVIR